MMLCSEVAARKKKKLRFNPHGMQKPETQRDRERIGKFGEEAGYLELGSQDSRSQWPEGHPHSRVL